jgi:hypothetical protein
MVDQSEAERDFKFRLRVDRWQKRAKKFMEI